MCFSLLSKPIVAIRNAFTRIVSTSTINTFTNAVVLAIGIHATQYASNVTGIILNITPWTNSKTGNWYNFLKYHRRTNRVAKFIIQRTASTLLGEWPNFKHIYAIGKFDKIITDIRIWYVFIFPVAWTENHNGPCKASNNENINMSLQNETAYSGTSVNHISNTSGQHIYMGNAITNKRINSFGLVRVPNGMHVGVRGRNLSIERNFSYSIIQWSAIIELDKLEFDGQFSLYHRFTSPH